MKRLSQKIAVITGGARGIGKAAVIKFLAEGAKVIVWDANQEEGVKLVVELKAGEKELVFIPVDVTNQESVVAATQRVISEYGKIDILINNAGITKDSTLMKMTAEQWQKVIDVNLTGVFNCTQAVAKYMIESGSGKIINTSSIVGLYGNFGQTNYVATKSGIIGMTKVWARELGRKGICVNAVAPGFIATEMVGTIPEKVINSLVEKTPLGRLGSPEDIANAYLFLASDESNYVNGTVISVDGGLVL
ncbi:MAG: 3-oxoacyl-ACP reductase FabG [Ignavibacteriaceae bacterium]|nr:3-oxoacyl-ACP reductase FabG [Ignavibacteriaceae bacterium]